MSCTARAMHAFDLNFKPQIDFFFAVAAARSESEIPPKRRSLMPALDCTQVPDAAAAMIAAEATDAADILA